jgi:hypothetical protein
VGSDTAAGAVQELGPHFRLQLLEHGGESGLGDTEIARGTGHVAGTCDGAEIAEGGQFHGKSVPGGAVSENRRDAGR